MAANSGRRLLRSLLVPTLTGVAAAGKVLTCDSNKDLTGLRNLTITGTLVAPTQAVTDSTWSVVDDGDATKVFKVQVAGNTTGITTTLATQSTGAATITLPAATSTLATLAGTEALTGKTINGLTITTSTGTLTIPNSASLITAGAFAITLTASGTTGVTLPTSGTLATLAGSETLSGKTLTDPIVTNVTRCTAQLDKTDATLTNITGLSQTVAVGTYRFRYVLPTTCGGTGGTKTAFKYTTTVVSAINYISYGYTASAVAVALGTTTTDQATHIASNTAAVSVIVEGTMTVSTGGTIALQFAENSANSTSSVLIGAYMEFTRIA